MLATIRSGAVHGIEAASITVEVDCAPGLPQFTVVGLAAGAVKESRERVVAALVNSGFTVPPRRTTVNLAPADLRKEGSGFDLPIALALLVATGQLDEGCVAGITAVGELALDGSLRSVRGVLPIARLSASSGCRRLLVPPGNVAEASLVHALPLATGETLAQVVAQLERRVFDPLPVLQSPGNERDDHVDLQDVVGQTTARRALEIAAAGDHGLLLVGPPGAGKTLLARCMPSILPPLTEAEALDVIAVHSVAGMLAPGVLSSTPRPFRAPHHSISTAGLIGGGTGPRPGEVTLAHLGVLFLDELLEFPRHTLDAMRQPLEDGHVVIARAAGSVRYPAQFTLVGAMNPCPCGYAGDRSRRCVCSAAEVLRYRARLSGPMTDRIDLHVTVAALPIAQLREGAGGESTATVRSRVQAARTVQRQRYAALRGVHSNGRVPGRWLDRAEWIESGARSLLATAAERLSLSARGYHRVLRVARTIADLAGEARVREGAVSEALRFRPVAAERGVAATREVELATS